MSEIAEVIEQTKERFMEMSPEGMMYPAERGFVVQILKGNDYLMSVAQREPASLQQAMTNVAAIGLSLSPAEKLAYLIPRKGKICLDISYMGLCRIATNSGSIEWIQSELVYSNDTFKLVSAGEKPIHEFDPFNERGEFKGGYCIAKTSGGDYLTTVMSAEEIHSVRDRSEAYKKNNGPWLSDFVPMAKKTVVRRAFNMWPRTDQHRMQRMALAVEISNNNEGFEPLVTSPDLGQYTDEAKKYFDQVIADSDALEMHVLRRTTPEVEFNNLYSSFEKGTKGKYQRIIDNLIRNGHEQFEEYLVLLSQGHDVESEVSESAFKLIQESAE